jgi:hypothetical protein
LELATASKVTSNSRVKIPMRVRDYFGITPGTRPGPSTDEIMALVRGDDD